MPQDGRSGYGLPGRWPLPKRPLRANLASDWQASLPFDNNGLGLLSWCRGLVLVRRLVKGNRLRGHDSRDFTLVDEAGVAISLKQETEAVEACDATLQPHASDEKDGQRRSVLLDPLQEGVLQTITSRAHAMHPECELRDAMGQRGGRHRYLKRAMPASG